MKKRLIFLLVVLMLFAAATIFAADSSGTGLRFSSPKPVYSITAYYDVLTENVDEISVTFDPSVAGSSFANYLKDSRELRIAAASADPVNLSKAVAAAVAVTGSDSNVAPELKLTYLKLNGEEAAGNVIPVRVTAARGQSGIRADLSLKNDLLSSVNVQIGIYDVYGKLLGIKNEVLSFEHETQTFQVPIGDFSAASKLKVFFLNETWQPCAAALECTIT